MTQQTRARSIDLDNPFAGLQGLTELVLVRHGEQVLSSSLTAAETIDPPLSELGERQALAVARRLQSTRVDAVYCSPLQRAAVTGRAIADQHSLDVTMAPELVEFDHWKTFPPNESPFETLPREEISTIFREHVRTRMFDSFSYAEDAALFRTRVLDRIAGIVEEHPGQRVVVACHSGVINAIVADAIGSRFDMPVRVHHTSVTVLRAADTRRAVLSINDFAHVLPFQSEIGDTNL